jgi:hypothetical protein
MITAWIAMDFRRPEITLGRTAVITGHIIPRRHKTDMPWSPGDFRSWGADSTDQRNAF